METVGWAAAAVMFISGAVWVLGHALDQVPVLSRKFVKAVRSVRQVRDELSRPRSAPELPAVQQPEEHSAAGVSDSA
jgi:hypothetical protein